MLPAAASMALIEGSPSKPGPFTFRLKFPANYRIPPHWHPVKMTVISGTFNMGFGDELDIGKGKTLPTGSIFEMPERIHHFGWTSEETIIQEHGVGPLSAIYLNQAHDRGHQYAHCRRASARPGRSEMRSASRRRVGFALARDRPRHEASPHMLVDAFAAARHSASKRWLPSA